MLSTHRLVRTKDVEVRVSDGGSSFKNTASGAETTVGDAKKEIARVLNRSATTRAVQCEDGVDAKQPERFGSVERWGSCVAGYKRTFQSRTTAKVTSALDFVLWIRPAELKKKWSKWRRR